MPTSHQPLAVLNGIQATKTIMCAIVSAEHLKVVFSSGSSAIGSSTVIYDSYPNDHSPCYTTGNGRTFTIHGDC
ncbi:hypothetical protein ASPSYDRAFT_95264 [Aspergillus sydowii CBS 593.65]|uniref:Uncharacterized protein n=1 Tax=Aspergillus sydowii CBS 593.65 TaxID=1036612 RepID=A0A1L9T0A8_9EURO|nr:uncharacterized protein ASPSYDRAFT_95264 [Aspergillus sydowii CBS 593.65]OJJ52902.1 hypothetical protein ASPSYDRAFT_95264 [Aspergillus sydowii CBS 593.65]